MSHKQIEPNVKYDNFFPLINGNMCLITQSSKDSISVGMNLSISIRHIAFVETSAQGNGIFRLTE